MSQENPVYLNGEYLALSEAKIPVLDRGFLFGDGVYEVIPVYNQHFFRMTDHLSRLDKSLSMIKLPPPYTREEWPDILQPLLSNAADQYIYLQITRGVAGKRDHAFPSAEVRPTVFAMASPISPVNNSEQGVKAITLEDSRWRLCHIKAITLLSNILHRQEAVDNDSAEAILFRNGTITEGAASNVFAVIDDIIVTPPLSPDILPGVTRCVILELAGRHGLQYAERSIALHELKTASEIWLTSSTREILPVSQLDNQPTGDGKPGPVWQMVNRLFQEYKQSIS